MQGVELVHTFGQARVAQLIARMAREDATNCVQAVMSQGAVPRVFERTPVKLWNRGPGGALEWCWYVWDLRGGGEKNHGGPWRTSIGEAAQDLEDHFSSESNLLELVRLLNDSAATPYLATRLKGVDDRG